MFSKCIRPVPFICRTPYQRCPTSMNAKSVRSVYVTSGNVKPSRTEKEMEVISDPEVFLDMDVAAEEVVMEDEVGAEVVLQASVDDVNRVHSLDLLSPSNLEQLWYPEDSSEDEHGFEEHRLAQSEKDNMGASCYQDGCLCWECGKCFQSLQMLMQHFRTHKAQVRCNMCRVTFRRMVSLSLHLENVHNNIVLYCTACHLAFKSKWEFNKHLEKHSGFELTPVVVGSLPKSYTSSEISEEIKSELGGLATKLENCETDSFSIPPGENLRNSIQESSSLPALVAKDHAYENRTDNGTVTTNYALRVRHTKTVTMVFPRESLPESAHQKKVQFFVFRNVDRDQEGTEEGGLDEREEVLQEEGEEKDVKPDPSSLIPPLPETLVSSGCKNPNSQVKQEGVISDSRALMWEGAPVEEEDEFLDDNHSDGGQSVHSQNSDSDSDVSESSTESISSGNSSGSSYHPPQRRVRKCNKKVAVCSICNTFFPDTNALIDHNVRTHPSIKPSRMYVCDSCREVFPQQDIYRSHQCPMKTTTKNQTLLSVPASTSNFFPDPASTPTTTSDPNASSWKDITSIPVMTSRLRPAVTSTAMSINLVTSSSSLVSIPSSNQGSCDVAVREPVRLSVPCPLQNPTLVCPVSMSSGSGLQLPSIMLPSSAPSSQSASMPVMATVVLSGSNAVGRVARVVLQSQGLAFPTPTLTQTVSPKQPVSLSSVPSQVKTVNQTQALPSVQLANLSLRGAIQPHTLIRSSQPPGSAATPLSRPLTVSVRLPNPAKIPISLPSPVPDSVPLRNPAPVSVTFSNSAPVSVPLRNPVPVSVPLRNPAPVSVPLRNPAPVSVPLRNPAPVSVTFSNSAPVSVPLRNPAPVSVTFSNSAPVSVPLRNPAAVSVTFSNSSPGPVPLHPVPASLPFSNSAPVTVRLNMLTPAPANIPLAASIPSQVASGATEPLKILGLYVNCSQELALQQRLNKSWRSKGLFFCRQCGAVSRQPSLGVRHRYLHRGSRRHRCHCGRTFLRRLHLLRHHVQHAEATRFVCAPCGRTFAGAHCLARHKQGRGDRGRKRKRVRKDCQTPFSCDCGQLFQRPTAFLWHKLKNHKSKVELDYRATK
ncbi:uncharacterized protein si:dkey-79d12.4 isoform X2 [Brienomyrus brachyistius]|uniref:uncharacterized protein si:dkey-79d12.4 isoform X2 n=1 Tax=Brienomyrus brachyistius TaxID=42636 RepID=UPI0020B2AE4D|nr:uncharacterized protein si:dkey-79d12.4 isoform X2 [Brienomyrus brachyistius]